MTMLPIEDFRNRQARGRYVRHDAPFDDSPGSEIMLEGLREHVVDLVVDEITKILPEGMDAQWDTEKYAGALRSTITIESDDEPDEGWDSDDVAWWRVEHRKLMRKLDGIIKKVMDKEEREISQGAKKLLAKVERLLEQYDLDPDDPEDFSIYRGYSGRGMYGQTSPLAFTISYRPNSDLGKKLQRLGFSYDSMGLDYIYYIRGEL